MSANRILLPEVGGEFEILFLLVFLLDLYPFFGVGDGWNVHVC